MDLNLIEEQLAGLFSGSWVTHNFKAGDAAVRISFGQNHKGMLGCCRYRRHQPKRITLPRTLQD